MSLQQLQDALQHEILPLVAKGSTLVLPDDAPANKDETEWFEIPTSPLPQHSYHEWFWVLSGQAHFQLNGRVRVMNPGDFCFLPPMMQHRDVYSRQTPPYRSLWFSSFNGGIWCVIFEYQPFGNWSVPVKHEIIDEPELRSIRANLQHELNTKGRFSSQIVQGLLLQLAGQLLRGMYDASPYPPVIDLRRISNRVHHFLSEHLHEAVTLEQVARTVFLSPRHVATLFKKETGQTVFEALARLRVERAAQLLTEDELPLREVAQAVGYRDPDQFARVFRRHTGVPPSRYGK